MIRGTGWISERGARRAVDRARSALRVGSLQLPDSCYMGRHPWILDQGSWESCTGHVTAQLIYGLTGLKTSPHMAWTMGRLCDGASVDTLSNIGVRTSASLRAMRQHGTCDYVAWNENVAGFGRDALPNALARMNAQRYNLDVSPVYARGQRLVELIVDAIARGWPCGLVVRTDDKFRRARDTEAVGPGNGSGSLHIVAPWYAEHVDGTYQIGCVNSWGRFHGDNGVVWLSSDRVRQSPFACIARGVS